MHGENIGNDWGIFGGDFFCKRGTNQLVTLKAFTMIGR